MTTYLIRRLFLMIPTLFGITLLTFLLLRLSPVNPALLRGAGTAENGRAMTAEQREEMIKFYDLDKTPLVAYFDWLGKVLRGDLSDSFVDNRPVIERITERMGLTLSITGSALIISYLVAIPVGVLAAVKRGQLIDRSISFAVFLLYSIPSFCAALLLIFFVAGGDYLNLLPMYGAGSVDASVMGPFAWLWDRILHMILPVICLTYGSLASISRYSRVSMLDALGQDFVRTARAKGLSERLVIMRHALRNALIPIITIFTLEIPGLISGAVIIESIFTLPGMGQLMFQSIDAGDYPVIMGLTLIIAIVTLVSYLLADILYAVVDPRITYE
ncbi:MAG TPA: ABC transporter permease [Candidatus Methylacidiphilales bacterium]|jgi:peptide/nickel transport system permease protein|nr:ABC transporter permease [Candidatus Methylacidiphilales bacterium]